MGMYLSSWLVQYFINRLPSFEHILYTFKFILHSFETFLHSPIV